MIIPQMAQNDALSCMVRGSGPGLLLCHGGGGSVQTNFGGILGGLAEHFTVIAPDYPGSGATPRATKPLELDGLVDQCITCALEAGVNRFAIAGYSTGCAVAIRAAVRFPGIITALILTHGFARLDSASQIRAEMLLDLEERGDREILGKFMISSMISVPFLDELSLERRASLVKKASFSIPQGFAEQIALTRKINVETNLPHVRVPTLIIHADQEYFIRQETGRSLAGIPGAVIAKLDTGHLPIDKPGEWLGLIQKFLARHGDLQ